MSLLKAKSPRIREKRLDTLNAWLGRADEAIAEFSGEDTVQRIRTFSQSTQDDLLYALRLLAGIRNSVVVIHAPRGCAAAALYHRVSSGTGRWIVSNLDQRDTIMGADRKLRKAVVGAFRQYSPEVIFIIASPVAAINNDDIQAVVEELHEELELPIVPVYVTGFASRNAVTGYDIALHAILKHLAGPRGEHQRTAGVNLLSVVENGRDRLEAERLLLRLGVELNTLPDQASAASFRLATQARLSLSLDQDSENYLGLILRDEYGVPYVEQPRPIGIGATGRWLLEAGRALGIEDAARELHEQESGLLRRELGDFSLQGVRVYIALSVATAFALSDLVAEFGGQVAGITVGHLDQLHKARLKELVLQHPSLQLHVADGQPFEELNIVRRLAPDLYIGDVAHISQVGRLGIPVVSLENTPVLGYNGVAGLARSVSLALKNRSFAAALAKTPTPYTEAWYRRSPNWHIKKEVR
ncbi:MAG: nitrogenase molybdenum-iron protein [Chlorobiaceae bacterium]|nr:nitrogenase molybdenum-iron protein [Chlorobiaceae bacterium]